MSNKTNPIAAALLAYLKLLAHTPDSDMAALTLAREALGLVRQEEMRENVEKILGALYQNGYLEGHVLFRVTIDDFATCLAPRLARAGRTLADLPPGELETLLVTAADYLNGEGMPWTDVINIAIDDEWPFEGDDKDDEGPVAT